MRRRPAFSLLEVLLSLAIMVGAIAALSALIEVGIRHAVVARSMTEAQLLCESKMAEITSGIQAPEPISQAPLMSAIDEAALLDAVRAGTIAGAALDVLTVEPPAADHPLMHEERILITPHIAWYSEEAKVDVRRRGAEEVVRVLQGDAPRAPVNRIE